MSVLAMLFDPAGFDHPVDLAPTDRWGATTVRAAAVTNVLAMGLGEVVVVSDRSAHADLRGEVEAFNRIHRRRFASPLTTAAVPPVTVDASRVLVGWLDQPTAAPALWHRLHLADLPVVSAGVMTQRAPMALAAPRWDAGAPGVPILGDTVAVELDVWASFQRTPTRDGAYVRECLGREPRAAFTIAARRCDGRPTVIENPPFLDDGTPMPTRFWLVDPDYNRRIGTIEASGAIDVVEAALGLEVLAEAHDRYAAQRDGAIADDHEGPRPTGGVGGTRVGVKCLHTHYAWYLAGGEDPVGAWVHEQLSGGEENE